MELLNELIKLGRAPFNSVGVDCISMKGGRVQLIDDDNILDECSIRDIVSIESGLIDLLLEEDLIKHYITENELIAELAISKTPLKRLEENVDLPEEKKERASNGMYIGEDWEDVDHYFIDSFGYAMFDNKKAIRWFAFDTEEDAIRFVNKQKALAKIWQRKTENDWDYIPDWKDEREVKYYILYAYSERKLISDWNRKYRYQYLTPYYSSKEIAEKAIKELEKEYKILFNVN